VTEAAEVEEQVGEVVRQLRTELSRIREAGKARDVQLRRHGERFHALDRRVSLALKAFDELQDRANREFGRSRRALRQLAGHTRWLETRIRLDQHVEPVDLEAVDGELTELVARVHESRNLRARLLTPVQRAEQQQLADDFAELEKAAAEHRHAAVASSRALATVLVGGGRQRRNAAGYRRRRRDGTELAERIAAGRPAAQQAQAALDADERRIQEYHTHSGANAGAEIAEHLRARIDAAVRASALFPAWFTITELGHQPPAERAAQWRDTATSLLLYRITFRVTDPTVALGPPPGQDDGPRAEWHDRLVRALRELA
jgi:hypothetical protein